MTRVRTALLVLASLLACAALAISLTHAGPAGPAGPTGPPGKSASPPKRVPPSKGALTPGELLQDALYTPEGISGNSAQASLKGILSGKHPYHRLAGSTQKRGSAQTGTYVKPGGPTYFMFSQGGVLHVRESQYKRRPVASPTSRWPT